MPSLTEIGVAFAVIGAGFAIVRDLFRFLADRKRDAHALDVAKAQQPEIMRQLDLGNFRNAGEGIALAQQMMRDQLDSAQAELVELRPLRGEVDHLRRREQALEAESAGWAKRQTEAEHRAELAERIAVQADARAEQLASRVAELEREVHELRARLGEPGDTAGHNPHA